MEPSKLGKQLAVWRKARGWSQAKAAEFFQCSASQICFFETGRSQCTERTPLVIRVWSAVAGNGAAAAPVATQTATVPVVPTAIRESTTIPVPAASPLAPSPGVSVVTVQTPTVATPVIPPPIQAPPTPRATEPERYGQIFTGLTKLLGLQEDRNDLQLAMVRELSKRTRACEQELRDLAEMVDTLTASNVKLLKRLREQGSCLRLPTDDEAGVDRLLESLSK